ncbi:serine/threonine-protein kinase [Streptomyces sp. CoT10]|uniref:serine/threonine-protein kinase n=1 Tax=Streptomyces sp. CoT10 TaxID=2875762 RepID=UPI001CD7B349|nr:serine/threonine-protein kinase [Streptomyces sp. CoT10]
MGEVFAGRYELADPVGRGGVGAVWRAWDHRRRRYVAAKVLQQRDAHSLLRFVREQALRIDHPHVLAPASWAADDDKVLFTMDLVAGGSLVHLVGDYGPLPPAFVCTLLDQLLSGLAAVHAEGVVHRDIKPANILLEATGTGRPRLRLSDFGIAMRLGEPRLTETNLVVGTPGYLAPEQMMGAEPDFPADLFATGLVALYLLQGAKPDARALVEYFAEHGTPGAPKGVAEPLWQVVATLLQPDPQARFRTATGARKALATCAELLPEPGPDDELIEIFDQLGPLPPGFGPEGPLTRSPGVTVGRTAASASAGSATGSVVPGAGAGTAASGTGSVASGSATASGTGGVPDPRLDPREGTGSAPRTDGSGSSTGPPQPSTMSDTGSFHLPPPRTAAPEREVPRHRAAPPQAVPPPAAPPQAVPPAPAAPPSGDVPLEPAVQPATQPPVRPPVQPAAQPVVHVSPHDPTHVLSSPDPRQRADVSTASYTAESPQVPVPALGISRHRARRPRRPGPPATVAVPLLLLALACYAIGFWALSRL